MKSTRAFIMILVSLLAGTAAVWMAARWIGQQAAGNTTSIVVAGRDIDAGALLNPSLLQEITWPSGALPVGAIKEMKQVEGRVAGTALFKGELLLEAKLAPEGASGGLSSTIQSGKRAISIQVNEIVGVAGYIRPGSVVDLMVNTREGTDKVISKIVLEKILVLAAAQDDKRDQTKPKVVSTVTLEVDPQQAEKIDLARHVGTLSLVLRNPLDRGDVTTAGARRDDLLVRQAAVAPGPQVVMPESAAQAPRSAPRTRPAGAARPGAGDASSVEVIRGVQKANATF